MKDAVVTALSFLPLKKEELAKRIEAPKDPSKGDFALPCFTLAGELKQPPAEIAKNIAEQVVPGEFFERIVAEGPYVNFFTNKIKLAGEVIDRVRKEGNLFGSQKIKERAFIEISSPNTNKPLHLGHIRNIILGQAMTNIMRHMGNTVIVTAINNDRGVHICKSMLAYDKFGNGVTPEKMNRKPDHFVGDYYVKFAQKAKENPELEIEAQTYLQQWETGDKKMHILWKQMRDWALAGFTETYKKFNVHFDTQAFESEIYKHGKDVVQSGLAQNVFIQRPDGSIYADLTQEKLGEKTLLRKDGTSIYVTQDLYLAQQRHKELDFNKGYYVVATEQNHHFRVLFTLLKKLGHSWADKLYHLNYGLVHLESGRMKSREGTVVDADNVLEEMTELAMQEVESRYPELHADEAHDRAFAIAMAALRYYFLKVERLRDVTFKPKESLRFDGDTGPYLLYSYARSQSILRKANYNAKLTFSVGEYLEEQEKALVRELAHFPDIVKHAYEAHAPNVIANYAFTLAKTYSDFYHTCQVIGSDKEAFRLHLVHTFGHVMKNALNLLGIPVIAQM